MKLEYIADGSIDCPLIRLYEFTETEAALLLANVSELAQGTKLSISLSELSYITPVDSCELIFILGEDDQGIADSDGLFMCVLTQESWKKVAGLIEPFCSSVETKAYKCLDETGEVSLMLSPSGSW
ncbi:MAG: hypothetical protein GWO07_01570 [Candidatus Dadabacteria bacterium]|nr:hypothetical protein [Candidatus Dadabacteria bacterium]NIS07461.1 hypothetical protein [Candidatus Dadabacteria bacterium]NIV42446.1 hypothetical protein [Candidatus Dadabacteria bacterium]NIY21105.1 hypothetical protein [Candidatus Dadabacteria bacterium]